jgi:hypothetical protein
LPPSAQIGQLDFDAKLRSRREVATLGAKFVPLDGDCGASLVAADYASVDHELHRAVVIEQDRPRHREFDRHAGGEHTFRGKPDAAAGDVHRFAVSSLGNPLTVKHLVADFLFDLETPLVASFALAVSQ